MTAPDLYREEDFVVTFSKNPELDEVALKDLLNSYLLPLGEWI